MKKQGCLKKKSEKTRMSEETQYQHPADSSSRLSQLTWSWFFPLLRTGWRRQIRADDVWELPSNARAGYLYGRFMDHQRDYPNHSLPRTLVALFWRRWATAGALYVAWCVCAGVQPWLVAAVIQNLEKEHRDDDSDGILLAGALFVATLGYSFSINHTFAHLVRNATRIRSTLMTLIYRKTLRLSLSNAMGTGETTNLISNDCEKVYDAHLFLHYLWASPLFVLAVILMAALRLGVAALIGFGMLLLVIPLQAHYGKQVGVAKRRMLPKTDARTNLFAQVLTGIQVVKLYNWEEPYCEQLNTLRKEEVSDLRRFQAIRAGIRAVLFVAPALIPSTTIAVYVALGHELTLEVTFLAISFFSIVRFPTLIIPMAYSMYHEMMVSLARIEAYLALPDAPCMLLPPTPATSAPEPYQSPTLAPETPSDAPGTAQHLVDVVECGGNERNGTGGVAGGVLDSPPHPPEQAPLSIDWTTLAFVTPPSAPSDAALRDVAVAVPAGALVGVVGAVGAGKTALLLGLLDELHVQRTDDTGTPLRPRAVGYFSQESHILNGTFEDNVTFGLPFEQKAFDEVVEASCLDADLAIMPAGSKTEIGEHGVNLSGGQKARVSFARLLYHRHRCALFLLDDPFAAVDVHVGRKMFDRGIRRLLRGRTRVVCVSSQTDLLQHADVVYRVRERTVAPALDFKRNTGVVAATDLGPEPCEQLPDPASLTSLETTRPCGDGQDHAGGEAATPPRARMVPTDTAKHAGAHLSLTEHRKHGGVAMGVYMSYFDFARPGRGGVLLSLVVASYVGSQMIRVMCDVWLAWWADAASRSGESETPSSLQDKSDGYWTYTLALWNVGNIVSAFSRSLWCASLSVESSRGVHTAVLQRLLNAPLGFFQRNPPGRILNRLSTDLHRIDTLLPDFLYQFLDNFFVLFSAVVLSVAAVPWLLVLLALLVPVYYQIQDMYRRTSRELNRVDGVTKSPIFGTCSESLFARVTMRAFGALGYFTKRTDAMIDHNLKVYFVVRLLERWISTYLNLAASVFGATLVVVAVVARGTFNPAMVGLALVYCLQLMGLGSWTMMLFVQVESNMTSLERVTDLCRIEIQEPPERKKQCLAPPPDWPHRGTIKIADAKLRYRPDLPLALTGLTLSVQSCEKLGICGRTGAGKSSILALLFRLFEPEEGSIIAIDGINVTDISLSDLRRSLSIVPQDPVLFNGSVRTNLDPFLQRCDAHLWAALDQVTLKHFVRGLDGQLDASVGIGGDRLSFGQRQLVCIARALLKESRILLCDEATSSVDRDTDATIQRVIRNAFKDRTVLTIAHRIDTITDSDKIVVLDQGSVVEYGTPAELSARSGGYFASILAGSVPHSKTQNGTDMATATEGTTPANTIDGDVDQYKGRRRNASMVPVDTSGGGTVSGMRDCSALRTQAYRHLGDLSEDVVTFSDGFARHSHDSTTPLSIPRSGSKRMTKTQRVSLV
eukprot:m.720956 g.720956  ORF g.720956 m.720956 type:complete len:1460 (+) comp23010_c0_seq3:362-4741(+)